MVLQRLLNNNNGITLVESIVVTSIISVLALLGTTVMNQYVHKAKKTQYIYDSKIAEDVSTIYYIQNDRLPVESLDPVDKKEFEKMIKKKNAYSKEGLITNVDRYLGEDYYYLEREFVEEEVNSKLEGNFLVNCHCDIVYVKH